MDRVTLYVPETLNDGSVTPMRRLASYEDELIEIAHGFTLTHAIGVWRSPEQTKYREPLRLYSIDVPDAQTVLERLLELAGRIRVELAQEALYVTVSPVDAMSVTEYVAT
jgi:hypothetical protein